MDGSVAFDRAAAYYDRTRAVSPEAMTRVVDVVTAELAGAGPVLEIGVGTGMISLPLSEAGLPMRGVDLSRPMLSRLVEKAGALPFPLVQGDATRLPLRDASCGGGVMRHVLHLIPDWEVAVREAVRVIRPGGVLLVNHGTYPEPYWSLFERFVEDAGVERPWIGLSPGDLSPLDDLLESLGATARRLEPVIDRMEEPLADFVEGMRTGLYSWTWKVDEGTRARAADAVARWGANRFGPLEVPAERELEIEFRAYDLA